MSSPSSLGIEAMRRDARKMCKRSQKEGEIPIQHTKCLEIVAMQNGYKSWSHALQTNTK